MAMKHGLGDLPLGVIHLGQGFEDRPAADAHLRLDAGEIEKRLGEGAIHVEEDGCG